MSPYFQGMQVMFLFYNNYLISIILKRCKNSFRQLFDCNFHQNQFGFSKERYQLKYFMGFYMIEIEKSSFLIAKFLRINLLFAVISKRIELESWVWSQIKDDFKQNTDLLFLNLYMWNFITFLTSFLPLKGDFKQIFKKINEKPTFFQNNITSQGYHKSTRNLKKIKTKRSCLALFIQK